jgi:predicted GNAT superfamily acetyltransferase
LSGTASLSGSSATITHRPADRADFPAILALNRAYVAVLSPLDEARLATLHACAALHRVVEVDGDVAAFMLAMREDSPYDGANFRWFVQRHERFLYVDRIVVARHAQGHGIGRLLYRLAIALAAHARVPWLTCEVDVEPPNPTSQRFHRQLGFRQEGRRQLDGGKTVAMLALEVPPATGPARHG